MKIAIDRYIPFIEGVFEPYGAQVVYCDPVDPAGADALIIRTRTRCDKTFLENHNPKIIATATIGYDHIDTKYCQNSGIEVATAAGCNARGVAQWVFAALIALGVKNPSEYTIGIVGVGNVGSVVAQVAGSVGFRVLLCDPPRQAKGEKGFITMDELLSNSDIVTLHVPLDETTRDMVSADFLTKMRPDAKLINSSRGEVIDEQALLNSPIRTFALDVWRNEPKINLQLMKRAKIATPHIAGYSLQGKAMGTAMSVRSVARVLRIAELAEWYPPEVAAGMPLPDISWNELSEGMKSHYDIIADDERLRKNPELFEKQRSNYNFRNEFF